MTMIEKCEPPSTAVKVEITSLNSHFQLMKRWHKIMGQKVSEVG